MVLDGLLKTGQQREPVIHEEGVGQLERHLQIHSRKLFQQGFMIGLHRVDPLGPVAQDIQDFLKCLPGCSVGRHAQGTLQAEGRTKETLPVIQLVQEAESQLVSGFDPFSLGRSQRYGSNAFGGRRKSDRDGLPDRNPVPGFLKRTGGKPCRQQQDECLFHNKDPFT